MSSKSIPLFQVIKPNPIDADWGEGSAALDSLSQWLESNPETKNINVPYSAPVDWGEIFTALKALSPPATVRKAWTRCCEIAQLEQSMRASKTETV